MSSPNSAFSERPFMAGSLVGLRAFGVNQTGTLTGVWRQADWTAGENAARCFRHGDPLLQSPLAVQQHRSGGFGCECGFYAYFLGPNTHLHYAFGLLYGARFRVGGIIEGYGLCTVGTHGFRAEKARILALVLPEGSHARVSILAKYPDVEVYLTEDEALAAHPLTVPEARDRVA